MRFCPPPKLLFVLLALPAPSLGWIPPNRAIGQVCNVKVVTAATPDYHDLPMGAAWTTVCLLDDAHRTSLA